MSQDNQKPDGNQIEIRPNGDDIDFTSESKVLRWWDNYWYHYKWHTIIGLFFVFVIVFCVVQTLNDPKDDILIAYCGPKGFQAEEMEDLREAMNRIMPEDFDGNGEKYAEVVRYQVFSEEELLADKEANDGKGTVNLAYNAKQLSDFNSFMSFGEASVYLVSEHIYGLNEISHLFKLAHLVSDGRRGATELRRLGKILGANGLAVVDVRVHDGTQNQFFSI